MFLLFLIIIFNLSILSSDTPNNESTSSWNLMRLIFGVHKPLTPAEVVTIEEKNRLRRIDLECRKRNIARLECSSDDESVKEKLD